MGYNTEKLPKLPKAITSENNSSNIVLTITFTDPDLTAEELNEETLWFLEKLEESRDIKKVERVRDPNLLEGEKGFGAFIAGAFATVITELGCHKALSKVKDVLQNKPKKHIDFNLAFNGLSMKVSATSQEDVQFALDKIEEFINKHKDD